MNITTLQLALNYRAHKTALQEQKRQVFRKWQPVFVKCYQYVGFGYIGHQTDEPADQITVCLENGNAWCYPVEHVTPVSWWQVDHATRRRYLRERGFSNMILVTSLKPKLP